MHALQLLRQMSICGFTWNDSFLVTNAKKDTEAYMGVHIWGKSYRGLLECHPFFSNNVKRCWKTRMSSSLPNNMKGGTGGQECHPPLQTMWREVLKPRHASPSAYPSSHAVEPDQINVCIITIVLFPMKGPLVIRGAHVYSATQMCTNPSPKWGLERSTKLIFLGCSEVALRKCR